MSANDLSIKQVERVGAAVGNLLQVLECTGVEHTVGAEEEVRGLIDVQLSQRVVLVGLGHLVEILHEEACMVEEGIAAGSGQCVDGSRELQLRRHVVSRRIVGVIVDVHVAAGEDHSSRNQ